MTKIDDRIFYGKRYDGAQQAASDAKAKSAKLMVVHGDSGYYISSPKFATYYRSLGYKVQPCTDF